MAIKHTDSDENTKYKRVIIYVSADLHRALKVRCAAEGEKIQDVMRSLIEEYMKGYKGPKL